MKKKKKIYLNTSSCFLFMFLVTFDCAPVRERVSFDFCGS
jgi:hypothetical protein